MWRYVKYANMEGFAEPVTYMWLSLEKSTLLSAQYNNSIWNIQTALSDSKDTKNYKLSVNKDINTYVATRWSSLTYKE